MKIGAQLAVRLLACLAICVVSEGVLAIGDSAGGSCNNPDLVSASIGGTPYDLEREIDKTIERYIQNTRKNRSVFAKLFNHKKPAPIQRLRQIFVTSDIGCAGSLIDNVVAGGNLQNARYLLDLGANPDGRLEPSNKFMEAIGGESMQKPSSEHAGGTGMTTFMRCRYLSSDRRSTTPFFNENRSNVDIDKMKEVYAFLFSRGANPNATFDQSGSGFPGNGLHYCHDPEVIRILLENGIDSDLQAGRPGSSFTGHTAFESHLHHYIFDKEPRELQIAKLIRTKARTNRVDPQIEFSICRACGRRQMPNTCEEISSVVDVSDARIFTPKGYVEGKDGDVSVARCHVLTSPECKNSACYWRARLKQLTKHSIDTDMLYNDSEDL